MKGIDKDEHTFMCESVICVNPAVPAAGKRPLAYTSGGAYTKKGANAPFSFLLHPLILLHRLGRDSSGRLGAVAHLRVGGTRADGAPRLTTRQSGAQRHAKKHGR